MDKLEKVWNLKEIAPQKPEGIEYGYFDGQKAVSCSPEDLKKIINPRSEFHHDETQLEIKTDWVFIPQKKYAQPPGTVDFLKEDFLQLDYDNGHWEQLDQKLVLGYSFWTVLIFISPLIIISILSSPIIALPTFFGGGFYLFKYFIRKSLNKTADKDYLKIINSRFLLHRWLYSRFSYLDKSKPKQETVLTTCTLERQLKSFFWYHKFFFFYPYLWVLFVLSSYKKLPFEYFALNTQKVFSGEIYRLLSYWFFIPSHTNFYIFIGITLILFQLSRFLSHKYYAFVQFYVGIIVGTLAIIFLNSSNYIWGLPFGFAGILGGITAFYVKLKMQGKIPQLIIANSTFNFLLFLWIYLAGYIWFYPEIGIGIGVSLLAGAMGELIILKGHNHKLKKRHLAIKKISWALVAINFAIGVFMALMVYFSQFPT